MRPTQVFIDTEALTHNVSIVKQYAPRSKIVAMLKANAYGHGLDIVSETLKNTVDMFGVAFIDEALLLRKLGVKTPVLLAEGFFSRDELPLIEAHDLSVVIHNEWQLNTVLEKPLKKKIKVWLKFDAGMHRLGFAETNFMKAYNALSSCDWVHSSIKLMTHLACASEKKHTHTDAQLKHFFQLTRPLNKPLSIANSAAICSRPESHVEYVRPGIMLYGGAPLKNHSAMSLNLKQVMHFQTEIIALRHCKPGGEVGYDATWRSEKNALIATLPVGYGDGYPRHLKRGACVLIDNIRCPVVGLVSMDMITVDVSQIPHVKIADKVTLWNDNLPCQELAEMADTIDYELFCHASLRVTPQKM